MDKRASKLAQIIVEHSVNVKKGDNVVLTSSDFTGQDLITECYRLCLEKGANVYVDIFGTNFEIGRADFSDLYKLFISTASKKQLTTQPEILKKIVDWGDKFIRITSIHNPNFLDPVDKKKLSLWQNTFYPLFNEMVKKDWILTYFPTEGTAANAGMGLDDFTDYYYNASIVDYAKMDKEIKPLQDIMDKGKIVTIIAEGTNLKFSIAGRLSAGVGSGKRNIPDGECYIAPIEDTAEGYITFFNPQIDLGAFKKGKIIKKYDDGKVNIFFLGRLVERKGAIHLLKAYNKLCKRIDPNTVRLIIGGKGHLKSKLVDYVKKNKLKNVVFEGYIDEEQKADYYATCDLAVFPSTGGESFGIVLIEAMAAGKAVIGGDNDGYKTVLKNTGSLLVIDPKDTLLFSQKLEALVLNPQLREIFAKWGPEEVKKYSVDVVGKRLLELYDDAIHTHVSKQNKSKLVSVTTMPIRFSYNVVKGTVNLIGRLFGRSLKHSD